MRGPIAERALCLLGRSTEAEQAALEGKQSISDDWGWRCSQVVSARESGRHRLFTMSVGLQEQCFLEVAEPRELAPSIRLGPQCALMERERGPTGLGKFQSRQRGGQIGVSGARMS